MKGDNWKEMVVREGQSVTNGSLKGVFANDASVQGV
jgi:hypothetical protein